MKKITTLLCAFALPLLAWAQAHNTKISRDLGLRMDADPEAYQEVIIELADYVDAGALLAHYETQKTPLAQRSYEVITKLQDKAAATQPAVLAKIDQTYGIEKGSAQPVWIINAIMVRANAGAIERIATWPEVGGIQWNFPIENDNGSNMQPSVSVPNGSEPGHRAIKAPFMWAKGYTGYSRKGMIIDTGQDGDHPALAGNFWGNQVPKAQAWHGTGYPEDCADHGSHVTGTVCGIDRKTNDTIGVAYNAHWMGGPMFFPVNADGSGCSVELSQTIYTNVQSLQWAINPDNNAATTNDQPDAINNSWRSGNVDCTIPSVVNLINSIEAAGIAIVWSAGNEGPAASTVASGGNMNMGLVNTFAVGAVNGANSSFPIADFSSHGPSTCGGSGSLLIKPEVSAPGVSVRSAFNGGIYSSIDGTSMASPHVAGAVLLLKEAFPTLSGTQIKLALYNSATDLGAAGEDNVYGKGIINLESAFNLLVSEGNVPAPPTSYERDAILADVKVLGLCNGPVAVTVGFENGGTEPITSIEFTYGLDGGTQQTYNWTGNLATNTFVNVELPGVNGVQPGSHVMVVEITKVNGQADTRLLNNRFKTPFVLTDDEYATASVNSLQTQPVCANSRVLLTYETGLESNETPQWFANPSGGTPLAEGKSFLTPALSQNTTYYVSAASIYKTGKTGITGNSTNSKEGALEFDAYRAFKLKSVKVYADETGPRIIEVLNGLGVQIATKTVIINTIGEQRITLNLNIPAGNDYQLRLSGGKDLKHNASSPGYPHVVNNLLSIVRGISPAGVNTTAIYYYFFDWEIELPLVCQRTAVPVTVTASPAAEPVSFEASPTTVVLSNSGNVNFNDLTAGSTARFWNFGNGQTSTLAQPSTTYTAEGIYKVFMVATTANGCSNAAEKTITVVPTSSASEPEALLEKAVLYPNPTGDVLNIAFVEDYAPENADIRITDVLGRAVLVQQSAFRNANAQLNINTLSSGVYFVQVTEKGILRWSGKFVKK